MPQKPPLRGASRDLLGQLCLEAKSVDHDAPDEVQGKLPPVDDNELLLVSVEAAHNRRFDSQLPLLFPVLRT